MFYILIYFICVLCLKEFYSLILAFYLFSVTVQF